MGSWEWEVEIEILRISDKSNPQDLYHNSPLDTPHFQLQTLRFEINDCIYWKMML